MLITTKMLSAYGTYFHRAWPTYNQRLEEFTQPFCMYRWSLIAGRLPGRTANDIKNYWNTHLAKQLPAKRDDKDANSHRNLKVIKPRPHIIRRDWRLSADVEAPRIQHCQDEPLETKLPPSSNDNATCADTIVGTKNVDFLMSDIQVGGTQDMQKIIGSEDDGCFRDDDEFLLDGLKGCEDMQFDFSLWSGFE